MATSKKYDLLPVKRENDMFRVTFDMFTPRPHFILLPKLGVQGMRKDHSLKNKQAQQLIVTAREMLASSNISSGTLSIHRGSWMRSKKSRTAHFHLCVDVTNYLRIFEAKRVFERNKKSAYARNVKEYPYKTYHREAVEIIERDRATNSLTNMQSTSENAENLVYHSKHPKIAFSGNGTTEDLKNILIKMQTYAEGNVLIRDKDGNHPGCHLCLNLGSDSGTY